MIIINSLKYIFTIIIINKYQFLVYPEVVGSNPKQTNDMLIYVVISSWLG